MVGKPCRIPRISLALLLLTSCLPQQEFVCAFSSSWQQQKLSIRPFGTCQSSFTAVYGIRNWLRRRRRHSQVAEDSSSSSWTQISPPTTTSQKRTRKPSDHAPDRSYEDVSVCIIGGGISGLLAAKTAAKQLLSSDANNDDFHRVVVLEASPTVGGRVQSDVTDDGYVLDRGFNVFIEQYPMALRVFDYEKLRLKEFLPGALVQLKGRSTLARVSDPFRRPRDVGDAMMAPVGSWEDKLRILPLLFHVSARTVDELFEERETDTLTCLKDRWGFSDEMIDKFFAPFLEGIFLSPLPEQSSRMFHFVWKMFGQGAAALPRGGIGQVSQQLRSQAEAEGVEVRTNRLVTGISQDRRGRWCVGMEGKKRVPKIRAHSLIVATESKAAQRLISMVEGFENLEDLPENPQRAVGCLYYGFNTTVPVEEPILILSGHPDRGSAKHPINNVCFPSVVNEGYAPEGCGLCSVTVLKDAMEYYQGKEQELDEAVRTELCAWFGDEYRDDILNQWELKRIYYISSAQPGHFRGPYPANMHGGRYCGQYRNKRLPEALFVCGDHQATATLNGALESGVNAGTAASRLVSKVLI